MPREPKLTASDVAPIQAALAQGLRPEQAARRFRVSRSTVQRIAAGTYVARGEPGAWQPPTRSH